MLRQGIALIVLGLGAVSSGASAQCFSGPDGLTGPCWTQTTARLPQFPPVTLPATGICWNACDPQQRPIRLVLSNPIQVACGRYTSVLRVIDGTTGALILSGSLVLDYTRTWDEQPPGPAAPVQVYRFVAKTDMKLELAGGVSCLTPKCLPAVPTAFYYGYMDYAADCATGQFTSALVLFHNCDSFIHGRFSTFPGTFHPGESYALVGPSSAPGHFIPSINPPAMGPMIFEAVRNVPAVAGGLCWTEDLIANGSVTNLAKGCACPFNLTPPQVTARRIGGVATCVGGGIGPSTFLSANPFPAFPWVHMMTTSIGLWTNPVIYPGEELAWVDEVPIFFRDSCSAASGGPRAFGEVYYGASTSRGWEIARPAEDELSHNFTDLASNTSWAVPGPPPSTFMGKVLWTRNLIYFNVP